LKWMRLPSSINSMKKIFNIAHRGYTRDFPDNTFESFRAALDLGVDGIEFDIQETMDGELIVYHDDEINGIPIASQDLESLKVVRTNGKYTIPSLQEVLKLLGGNLILLIELKQVRSLERFLAILRAHTETDRVVLISFNGQLIARLAALAPDIIRGVITGAPVSRPEEISRESFSRAIGVRYDYLTAELISRAREGDIMIFVWGCSDAASVRQALQFDIDGIISDFPDLVKSLLNTGN
jgi:glycerophosphoryl diester phosphodiesterase